MSPDKSHILITGPPGIGKTTLVIKLAQMLKPLHPVGFYTAEIRKAGRRTGFSLVSLDDRRQVLASVQVTSRRRVGRYGVDVAGFEAFLASLDFFAETPKLVIIDEIGKMECFSEKFRDLVMEVLGSPNLLLATIAARGPGFIARVKARPDVKLFTVTVQNRDCLQDEILAEIRPQLPWNARG